MCEASLKGVIRGRKAEQTSQRARMLHVFDGEGAPSAMLELELSSISLIALIADLDAMTYVRRSIAALRSSHLLLNELNLIKFKIHLTASEPAVQCNVSAAR